MFKQSFLSYLQFVPAYILQGQVWRLVTWVVVPNASSPFMLLLTCYFYYWIAVMLEREWGTARFTLFYLSGMVLSVVIGMLVGLAGVAQINPYYLLYPMNLSYYLNLSIFLVLSVLYGEMQVLLFFVIPIRVKYFGVFAAVLWVFSFLGASLPGKLDYLLSMLNVWLFFAPMVYRSLRAWVRREQWKRKNRR